MLKSVDINSRKSLRDFERYVGKVDKTRRRQLTKELRGAVKPTLQKTRQSALAYPATTGKHSGLRQATARALSITTARGRVAIQISRKKMPAGQEHLPARMEGIGKWRHPLFGNTDKWYDQKSHPWFFPVINRDKPRVRKEIERIVRTTAKQLGRF